jgi:hypothetical protein
MHRVHDCLGPTAWAKKLIFGSKNARKLPLWAIPDQLSFFLFDAA